MHAVRQETNKEREFLKNSTLVIVEQIRKILSQIPVIAVDNYIFKKDCPFNDKPCLCGEGRTYTVTLQIKEK